MLLKGQSFSTDLKHGVLINLTCMTAFILHCRMVVPKEVEEEEEMEEEEGEDWVLGLGRQWDRAMWSAAERTKFEYRF